MDKRTTFLGSSESGIFCQGVFAGAFEKTAGAPPFADWETGELLRSYISRISARDREESCYVLVNALGAGEFFGSNINADYFPWNALSHEGDDYGYKTFFNAHAFQHHKNKDPERAFGVPVLSVLNTRMKRVELIIRLDRAKARQEGADGIITRIDKGEFPDVSMGCKVPYDICSICGQRSKTRFDYCEHMRPDGEKAFLYGPNKILPDGRKIYVINTLPRFFDISFVFIGADKTAKAMAKLAQVGNQVCMGPICTVPLEKAAGLPSHISGFAKQTVAAVKRELKETPPPNIPLPTPERKKHHEAEKTASACDCVCGGECDEGTVKLAEAFGVQEKKASHKKVGEILKSVPTGVFSMKTLPSLERAEKPLPFPTLERLAEHPLKDICGTTASLGIVLHPREFQSIILIKMGGDHHILARDMDLNGHVFREGREVADFDFDVEPNPEILPLLASRIRERTALGGALVERSTKTAAKNPLPTQERVHNPLLDKIAAAYNGYRRSLLTKVSHVVHVVASDPKLRTAVLGDSLVNMFTKTSSAVPLLTLDSLAYLMGAHLDDRTLLSTTAVAIQMADMEGLLPGAD